MENWLNYAEYRPVNTVVGSLKILPNVWSPQLQNERDIFVWLPASHETSDKHYPVLYMHDGQNLFDTAISFSGEWCVDETLTDLAAGGVEAIVVGIANLGVLRCNEYSPFTDQRVNQGGCGDAYLEFIVNVIKPLIDRDFRTLPQRKYTAMLGSSMGGLITLYAAFEYSAVFGIVGVLSPALWFGNREIFSFVQRSTAAPLRIYLDAGTAEGRFMVPDARRMATLLRAKGLDNALVYVEEPDAPHSEAAWSDRMHFVLMYMLRGIRAAQPAIGVLVE